SSRPTRSARACGWPPLSSSGTLVLPPVRVPETGARRWPRRSAVRLQSRHHWMAGKGKPRDGARRPKREKDDKPWKKTKRKACVYCKEKLDYVDYKVLVSLRKFVSERGRHRV